jgi:hypothetical protein
VVFQNKGGALSAGSTSELYLGQNIFYGGSPLNDRYVNSLAASSFGQSGGAFTWRTAASGTAGGVISFTQAMTLTAAGDLGVGTTSPTVRLDVAGQIRVNTTDNTSNIYLANSGTTYLQLRGNTTSAFINNPSAGPLVFGTSDTERARIDSSGNLLVGTTSNGAGLGYATRIAVDGGDSEASVFKTSAGISAHCSRMWNSATSGDNCFIAFQTEAGGTQRGSITYNRTAGLTAYNTTSDYRAKDISGSVTDSGALIDSTPVYMGKMKGATQERPMFIAHETPSYAHTGEKDAVDADGNPVYQQMDASALIPVMWAEIQSLRQRLSAANL